MSTISSAKTKAPIKTETSSHLLKQLNHHAYSKGNEKKPHSETVNATLKKSFPGAFPGNIVESKTYEKLA